MKPIVLLSILLSLAFLFGCSHSNTGGAKQAGDSEPLTGDAAILQTWQGDYPVDRLNLFPQDERNLPVGYIDNAVTFEAIWKEFQPGQSLPDIDFKNQLVIFARNTQFYNRINIGKVKVTDGVVEVLAMETMSALPIEEKVAMSLVVVERKGITGIQSGDKIISVSDIP